MSNCGFGHRGPYSSFKTWGPIVQACCGLTFTSGLPDLPPAGWGYSYMDHHGGNFMALAILTALVHRNRTGEGQWVDMSCTDAGATLLGPVVLDYTVNGTPHPPTRLPVQQPQRLAGDGAAQRLPGAGRRPVVRDRVSRRRRLARAGRDHRRHERRRMGPRRALRVRWPVGSRTRTSSTALVRAWCASRDKFAMQEQMLAADVPAVAVQRPEERIDHDPGTSEWGLWPWVEHRAMGRVRVDGLPIHLSETDWRIERAAPLLGQDNDEVYGERPRPHRRRDRRAPPGRGDLMARDQIGQHLSTAALPVPDGSRPGPLEGLRVVELASEFAAYCGRCSPTTAPRSSWSSRRTARGSAATRRSSTDEPDPERSLWFWHYNTNKHGVTLDLDDPSDRVRFGDLVASADIVLEAEAPGRLAALGIDDADLRPGSPGLIWCSVTPFGRCEPEGARAGDRPHDPRRRRAGVELWLRRPHDPAGARGRQPGLPHRVRARRDRRSWSRCCTATSPAPASSST